MNYKSIYEQIINKRKLDKPEGYKEKHHIIPRSLGGTEDLENIIFLTAREHFICHYLLAKIYKKESFAWYKMNHAFMMMKCNNLLQQRYYNSRLYEALKGNFSNIMKFVQGGKNNSQYGTRWICNIELKQNKKIAKNEIIPENWIAGRNRWANKVCPSCNKSFYSEGTKYCSKKCIPPKELKGSQLDNREKEFLDLYKETKSMNKALKLMGFSAQGDYYYWAKKIISGCSGSVF